MLSFVGVIILVKVSQTGIGAVPKGTARKLKLVRHEQLIYFGRGGSVSVSYSIFSFLVAEASFFSSREMTQSSLSAPTFVVDHFFLPT